MMVTVEMIRELDRLFLAARITDTPAAWSAYETAKARVDQLAKRTA